MSRSSTYHEHWYSGFTEAVQIFVPSKKNKIYNSMYGRNARCGVAFISPLIVGFLVFMAIPLFTSLYMSFCDVKLVAGEGFKKTWVGLQQYKYAFGVDPYFNQYLWEEVGQMAINTLATLMLSFVIAVILNQKFRGRALARVIFFLPVILSSGVLPGIENSNEFYNMMQTIGDEMSKASGVDLSATLQNLLSVSGVGGQVFDVIFQMIDAIYDIVMASGIQIIVFLSGLQSISPSLYEAAHVEGCTAWESFWKITFPIVSPLLLVNCIYTIIDFFMKSSNRVMERINEVMYSQFRFGESAAMSWIYFAVAVVFIAISSLIIAGGVNHYES